MFEKSIGGLFVLFAFCITSFSCDSTMRILTTTQSQVHPNHHYSNDYNHNSSSYAGDPRYHESMACVNIRPQHSIDIAQILGVWHGNQILIHHQDIPGTFQYENCVTVVLSDITDQMPKQYFNYDNNNNNRFRTISSLQYQQQQYQQQYKPQQQQQQHQQQQQPQQHNFQYDINNNDDYNNNNNNNNNNNAFFNMDPKFLSLVWTEGADTLVYTLNYTTKRPGLWYNVDEQHGSLAALNQYSQFKGSVQVVKAVNDHLVLTFCGNNVKSSVYTIVLSRRPKGLNREELKSIQKMLEHRGLSCETVREVCVSGASALKAPLTILMTLVLGIIVHRKLLSNK